ISKGAKGGDGLSKKEIFSRYLPTTKTLHEAESVPTVFVRYIVYVPVSDLFAFLLINCEATSVVSNLILSPVRTSSPLIDQFGLGLGFAVYGTVMVNGSPAITVISRMLRSLVIFGGTVKRLMLNI
ncbi:hypothetical protein ALC53_03164, partial [Atta colombica]